MTCTRIFEAGWRTALLRVVLVAMSFVTAPGAAADLPGPL